MKQVLLASGSRFTVEAGVSIIEGAQKSGLVLPHSCRTGRCSTCKCKIDGASEALSNETGLSDAEKAEGWVLACVRSPLENVVVGLSEIEIGRLTKPRMFPAKIDALELLSEDVIKVRLRLPPGSGFEYVAGQYIDVVAKNGQTRSYSMARSHDRGPLELHVRRVAGGQLSDYWFNQAKVNDLLRIYGPVGTFCLRHGPETSVVFLATGTGIAPVVAMLEELSTLPRAERPASVRVYWGGRTRKDLYCDPASAFDDAEVVTTLSRAKMDWGGARGYVQDHAVASILAAGEAGKVQVYACGSDAMISAARNVLESVGVPAAEFYSDAFVASEK